ncbi:unnamed protein product [Didymodactylos carnosus]|uniref:Uncharacterized protein n=1 Tax=Didymodactylos carnosus TaxID=1234261 RepID=A0A814NPU9_9BILA|nr:unnamed protein product [Didymodactylos carnosus]CAF1096708.1 unnamed protein product [Didymodactylos carnosus]CAF3820820.1 unnamed protein product [Didymodactylos carnosus]CAF3861969.1 unnamed protein product [Didymodactylos carnosus]
MFSYITHTPLQPFVPPVSPSSTSAQLSSPSFYSTPPSQTLPNQQRDQLYSQKSYASPLYPSLQTIHHLTCL